MNYTTHTRISEPINLRYNELVVRVLNCDFGKGDLDLLKNFFRILEKERKYLCFSTGIVVLRHIVDVVTVGLQAKVFTVRLSYHCFPQ